MLTWAARARCAAWPPVFATIASNGYSTAGGRILLLLPRTSPSAKNVRCHVRTALRTVDLRDRAGDGHDMLIPPAGLHVRHGRLAPA